MTICCFALLVDILFALSLGDAKVGMCAVLKM